MLTVVVLVHEVPGSGLYSGVYHLSAACHFGYFFEDYCAVDGVVGILAPGEGTVVLAEHCLYCVVIFVLEVVCDENAGIFLITFVHLLLREDSEAGHASVEIIR